jgi:hypothetical protein
VNVWLNGTSEDITGEKQEAMHAILHGIKPLGMEMGITILFNTTVLLLLKLGVSKDGAVKSFSAVWDAQAELSAKDGQG